MITIDALKRYASEVYPDNKILQILVVTQAVHESGMLTRKGTSGLALMYNNFFGIKAKPGEPFVDLLTTEYIKGKELREKQPFRRFKDIREAFEWHRRLMSISRYKRVWSAKTASEVFDAVYKSGYATDPLYPSKLMGVYLKIYG